MKHAMNHDHPIVRWIILSGRRSSGTGVRVYDDTREDLRDTCWGSSVTPMRCSPHSVTAPGEPTHEVELMFAPAKHRLQVLAELNHSQLHRSAMLRAQQQ